MQTLGLSGKNQISFLEHDIPTNLETVDPGIGQKITECKNIVNDREAAFHYLKGQIDQQLSFQHGELSKAATQIFDLVQSHLKSKEDYISAANQKIEGIVYTLMRSIA